MLRENLSLGFPTRSNTNWAVHLQKMRLEDLGRRGSVLCSENKGADQLRGVLCLCFRICKNGFSHDAAQIIPEFKGAIPILPYATPRPTMSVRGSYE